MNKKFCIFGMPRAGSTYLMSMIDAHPDAACYEELFFMVPRIEGIDFVTDKAFLRLYEYAQQSDLTGGKLIADYLNYVYAYNPSVKAVGFKIMYGHLRKKLSLIWHFVKDRYNIILLLRRNLFEHYMSIQIKNAVKVPHGESKIEKLPSIIIDTNDLIRHIKRNLKISRFLKLFCMLLPCDHKVFYYEDLVENKQIEMQKVFSFLNLDNHKVESKTAKRIQKQYSEIIENYDDVVNALRKHGYGYFIKG